MIFECSVCFGAYWFCYRVYVRKLTPAFAIAGSIRIFGFNLFVVLSGYVRVNFSSFRCLLLAMFYCS